MGVCRGHGGYTGICIWAVTQIRVCEEVKGIYLSSDDTAHMRNNTENFCVGPFCRWESKVKFWIHVLLKDLLFIGVEPVSILRIKPSSFWI